MNGAVLGIVLLLTIGFVASQLDTQSNPHLAAWLGETPVSLGQCLPAAEITDLKTLYTSLGGLTTWVEVFGWHDMLYAGQCPCDGTMAVYGVTCTNNRLTELKLSDNGLTGPIQTLSSLTELQYLHLDGNSITTNGDDVFPAGWAQNTELQILTVAHNRLNGGMGPGIGQLQHLQRLDISYNAITSIEGANWPAMTDFIAGSNDIVSSPAVEALVSLLKLETIDLSYNRLTTIGEFPFDSKLHDVYLSGNAIETLPISIGMLDTLYHLDVSHNRLQEIPALHTSAIEVLVADDNLLTQLPRLPVTLKSLNIDANRIATIALNLPHLQYLGASNGEIRTIGASNCPELTTIDLANNELQDTPQTLITAATRLTRLDLSKNSITTPPTLTANWALEEIDLSSNMLNAMVDVSGLRHLTKLLVHANNLNALPQGIFTDAALTYLDISYNDIPALPDHIADLTELTHLFASNTQLRTVAAGIGMLAKLQVLDLSLNAMTGIPDCLARMDALDTLDLSYNAFTQLSGPAITRPRSLKTLTISGNALGANFPDLSKASHLAHLHAAETGLTGARLTSIVNRLPLWISTLDLSRNGLQGPIPAHLIQLVADGTLQSLDLSGNTLHGWVPGDFNTGMQPNINLAGNQIFCPVPHWAVYMGVSDADCISVGIDRAVLLDTPTLRTPAMVRVLAHNLVDPDDSMYRCGFTSAQSMDVTVWTPAVSQTEVEIQCETPSHTLGVGVGQYIMNVAYGDRPVDGSFTVDIVDECAALASCGSCTANPACLWCPAASQCADLTLTGELACSSGWSTDCPTGPTLGGELYRWGWMVLVLIILILIAMCIVGVVVVYLRSRYTKRQGTAEPVISNTFVDNEKDSLLIQNSGEYEEL